MKRLFFDYASTTPVDERVSRVMSEFMTYDGQFANASSKHLLGLEVNERLIIAKSQLASFIKADINELIWTSGATESINTALKSFVGDGILTSSIEHKATLETCRYLSSIGKNINIAKPAKLTGEIEESILTALRERSYSLLSLSLVNNELGNILDLSYLLKAIHQIRPDILIHIDASQALGKIPIDLQRDPVDMMSFSAHKIYGPKGIGALFIRKNIKHRLTPLIHGGTQEYSLRSGTLPNHQIMGFSEAIRIASLEMADNQSHILSLSEIFLKSLKNYHLNGSVRRLPNILSISLAVDSETLMAAMPEAAVSTSSACNGTSTEVSHVLAEIISRKDAEKTIRVSFGKYLSTNDVIYLASRINEIAG